MPPRASQFRVTLLICLSLVFLTLAAYWPVFRCGFVNYDDDYYVTGNPHVRSGLTLENLRWAFTSRYEKNWHPLTWVSHMVDCNLYGLNPVGHHATNLLLHVINTLLLFLLLRRLTGARWRSALVAALFAVHPLHVESVAWVAERKDLLSTFFWTLTIWAYARYAEKPGAVRYTWVLLLFALGLMAKPMIVTLPCLLFLLDWWPLRRIPPECRVFGRRIHLPGAADGQPGGTASITRLIVEKLPLLAMSCGSSALTLWAQKLAIRGMTQVNFSDRLDNAVVAYVRYLGKTIWPDPLYLHYPPRDWPTWIVAGAVVILVGLTWFVIRHARTRPYLVTGWFWFLGALVPVIGLVQVGSQSMADRYTYVPLIGLFIMVAWGGHDLATRWRLRPALSGLAAGLAVAICVPVTILQVGYWRDSVTLFEHALRFAPEDTVTHHNLAIALIDRQQFDDAYRHLVVVLNAGTDDPGTYTILGRLLERKHKPEQASNAYRAALGYDADFEPAHLGLGVLLGKQGKLPQAISELTEAVRLAPGDWAAHDELGQVLLKQDQHEAAAQQFTEAVRLSPTNALLRCRLAEALRQSGQTGAAAAQYREAVKLAPTLAVALNNLAWILATNPDPQLRNGAEAVRLAEEACRLTDGRNMLMVGTLAAAYGEAGRFQLATTTVARAEAAAGAAGNRELVDKLRKMSERFRAGEPFHETGAAEPAR